MKPARIPAGPDFRRINWRVLTIALAFIAMVVLVSSFVLGMGGTLESSRVQARVLAENASAALVFEDDQALRELLHSLRHSPAVEAASFRLKSGRVVGVYRRSGTSPRNVPSLTAGEYMFRSTFLAIDEPVRSPEGEVGRFHMVVSLAPVYRQTAALALAMSIAMLLTFGVSFRALIGQIHERDARNAALLSAIPDMLFEVDLEGRFVDYHGPDLTVLELPQPRLLGNLVTEVLPPAAATVFMSALRDAATHAASSGKQFELRRSSESAWFELYVSRKEAARGEGNTYIVLARDITAHKEAEGRVSRMAYFDSLTGLPNRQSFLDRVNREIARAKHSKNKFGVLFMDIDGFKGVNDLLGHSVGDLILQSAAGRLHEGLRPSDVITRQNPEEPSEIELARLGGDEFTALILDTTRPEDSMVVAQRILELMRRPYAIEGTEVTLSSSIGIALFPDDGEDAATLLKHADTAMYHAKNSGRDNCQFYDASLTQVATKQLEMKAMLRTAIERNEFHLVYQPQIDAAGRIHSVEALIRWIHPQLGMIPPLDFIPLAEENGSIIAIGRWVLRTACTDAAAWKRGGLPVRVAVNLSPLQCRAPDLMQMVREALADSGLGAECLELEITEGALIEDTEATSATLSALRAHGVEIALDDFGTGYSSLAYLKRLPLSNLKVDRSFVKGLPDEAENVAIVGAILAMAHSLGFRVTAEGVETLEQAHTLLSMNCDFFQGYYFSRPVSRDEIPALLVRRWDLAVRLETKDSDPGEPLSN